MRTPTVVVTGVDRQALDSVMLSLSWDLPRAVAVRHWINPHTQVLTRMVSDASGLLEREEIPLEHACVSCALREDILPTLERLARDGSWDTIVCCLPVGTEAVQLASAVGRDARLARHLRLSRVIAAVAGDSVVADLLHDDLLRERDLHCNPYDSRGVGEVGSAQIEFADVVVLRDHTDAAGRDLITALAQPDAVILGGADQLDGQELVGARFQLQQSLAWLVPGPGDPVPTLAKSAAWRLDLASSRPFHPERLVDQIERLGTGAHRSRGSFWVPTRPGMVLEWGGAGGQLSIGTKGEWARRAPATRLVFTGVGDTPHDLVAAFEDLLITPAEENQQWRVVEDGLEPWLGDIRDVA